MACSRALVFLLAGFPVSCGGRVLEPTSSGETTDAATDTSPAEETSALVCTEFRYYECDTRCFKLEPIADSPHCISSAGCGDMLGRMTFEQSGRVMQEGKQIATFTVEGGALATVTRDGVTTRCVRRM